MQHLAVITFVICMILPSPVAGRAEESGQALRPSDKQEQKQTERERKRKEKEEAQSRQQAGVRCTRIKRKQ